jgi:hypothetical protein
VTLCKPAGQRACESVITDWFSKLTAEIQELHGIFSRNHTILQQPRDMRMSAEQSTHLLQDGRHGFVSTATLVPQASIDKVGLTLKYVRTSFDSSRYIFLMSNETVRGSGTLVPGRRNSVSVLRYLSLTTLNGRWLVAHQSARMVRWAATEYGSAPAEIGLVLAEVPADTPHSRSHFFELLLRFVVPSDIRKLGGHRYI